MKVGTVFLVVLLVALILLGMFGMWMGRQNTTVSDERSEMIDVWRSVSWFSVPPETVEHGEDSVIQWEDPGMEAHIRFLLARPEGEIYHSDVWDIQVLSLQPNYHTPHDVFLKEVPQGREAFTPESTVVTSLWEYYERQTFPEIQSLQDLRYFDSLQILQISLKPEEAFLTDLSGLEFCTNLKVVELENVPLQTLSAISSLTKLNYLTLDFCGTLDLQPLENLPNLSVVSLYGSDLLSLEPLSALPQLTYLNLGGETNYPGLEPLTKSTVAYLSLGRSAQDEKLPEGFDYAVLTEIPDLVCLDLSGHVAVDTALCNALISGCSKLQYLDIVQTPAADAVGELNRENLKALAWS